MKNPEELQKLTNEFQECQDVLIAISDATRQAIMLALIEIGCNEGMRVGEITEKTHFISSSCFLSLTRIKRS